LKGARRPSEASASGAQGHEVVLARHRSHAAAGPARAVHGQRARVYPRRKRIGKSMHERTPGGGRRAVVERRAECGKARGAGVQARPRRGGQRGRDEHTSGEPSDRGAVGRSGGQEPRLRHVWRRQGDGNGHPRALTASERELSRRRKPRRSASAMEYRSESPQRTSISAAAGATTEAT
jgi:hypothetical protein